MLGAGGVLGRPLDVVDPGCGRASPTRRSISSTSSSALLQLVLACGRGWSRRRCGCGRAWHGLTASPARSMSLIAGAREAATVAFFTRLAIAVTASKSPSEAIGKPASMTSTPISSRSSATSSFSSKRHGRAGGLLAVAQGGVENDDLVLGRRYGLSRGLGVGCLGHIVRPDIGCVGLWRARSRRVRRRRHRLDCVHPLSARSGQTGTAEAQGLVRRRMSSRSARAGLRGAVVRARTMPVWWAAGRMVECAPAVTMNSADCRCFASQ